MKGVQLGLRSVAVPLLLAGAAGTLPLAAHAEETAGANQRGIEEILVTARKRTESVLEIPETVAVISGENITRRNLTTLDDIGNGIANLNLSRRADGFPNVSIRGVGSFGNTQGVGFYLDDAQVFSDASSRFGDLERIEVLKGPQGTLYGGSNIGGAVKYVSKRPDSEAFSGRIRGRTGEQSIIDVEGSVNVPLGDGGWAMRLFGFTYEDDGFLDNPNTPRLNGLRTDNDKDEGHIEEYGARASIAGPLSDRLSVYAALRWNELDGPNNNWVRELDDDLDYPDIVQTTMNSSHERDTIAGTVEFTLELDGFDITSLTSYTDTDSERYTDVDLREEYILDNLNDHTMETVTQEIRFTSTHDGPLQWIAGGYYSKFEGLWEATLSWFDARVDANGNISGPLGCAAGMPTCSGVWLGQTDLTLDMENDVLLSPSRFSDREKTQLAAFANATYSWDAWEANVGLRVDRWENKTEDRLSNVSNDVDDVEVLPRVSITHWANDNQMFYFTYAAGHEPGGFNSTSFGNTLLEYEEEEANSYEIGFKGRGADGRYNISLAAFFIDYKSRQMEFQVDAGNGQLVEGIFSLDGSEAYGFEAEAWVQVTDALRLSAAFGWVDSEWDDGVVVQGVDISGTTPPVTQDTNWHLGADFEQPIGDRGLSFLASVQVNHAGEYEGLQVFDTVTNPDHTLVNAQVGVVAERWEFMVAAKNLFDEDHYVDLQRFPNLYTLDGGENVLIGTWGQPRLITASVTFNF
ncbi:MAG: TonB-dependent receptor [Pseudomonadales bacterium]